MIIVEIPEKLPSCNDYIEACRTNKYLAAKMKVEIEQLIGCYILTLPKFEKPVKIHFHWVEGSARRDLDNVCFSKKFILDALVNMRVLPNDSRKYVKGFYDTIVDDKSDFVVVELVEILPVCDKKI